MAKEMFDPAYVLLKEFYKAIENVPTIHQDGGYKKTQSGDLATCYDLEVKNGRLVNKAYISYADNTADNTSELFPGLKQIAASFSEEGVLMKAIFRHANYNILAGEKARYEGENLKIEGDFSCGIFKYTEDNISFERRYDAESFKKIKNPLKFVHIRKKFRKWVVGFGILAAMSAPFVIDAILSKQHKTPSQPAPQHERG